MTNQGLITIDPNIAHGKPCFKGTRIMVHLVLEMLAAGETPEKIIQEAYPQLTVQHIEAALQFAAEAMENKEQYTVFPNTHVVEISH